MAPPTLTRSFSNAEFSDVTYTFAKWTAESWSVKAPNKDVWLESAGGHLPSMGPPQRTRSVTGYVPSNITARPSRRLQLGDLPTEIHDAIFDFLDDIDATVLGLTSGHFYAIQRARIGKVPLDLTRMCPNDLEWCWRAWGHLFQQCTPDVLKQTYPLRTTKDCSPDTIGRYGELSAYRLKGQQWCNHCQHCRCQLWRHITSFFPGSEFCSISRKFGPVRQQPVSNNLWWCHRKSPQNPKLCGRHQPVGGK